MFAGGYMKTFPYAAYGSNLHPLRIKAKDRCPSAKLHGTSIITGWRLTFRKRSTDGSAKCDAEKTGNPSDELQIAVFDIPENEESALDSAEGLGNGYHKDKINLTIDGEELSAKIYLADEEAIVDDAPYDWYKQMVLLGAEYQCFPSTYTNKIKAVKSKSDNDKNRARRKLEEVCKMKTANHANSANAKKL
jgi:hypothetical protein